MTHTESPELLSTMTHRNKTVTSPANNNNHYHHHNNNHNNTKKVMVAPLPPSLLQAT